MSGERAIGGLQAPLKQRVGGLGAGLRWMLTVGPDFVGC